MVLIIENYKLKTVAFYIFVATVISFDLKGSENENEWNCHCCCCPDEGENKEEKNNENKKVGKKEKKRRKEKGGRKKEEEKKEDKEKSFILKLKVYFSMAIGQIDKNVWDNKEEEDKINEEQEKQKEEKDKTKKRLFIAVSNNVLKEITFEKLDDKLSKFLSYKKDVNNNTLLSDNLSLISYCPKEDNINECKTCEVKITQELTIQNIFDKFKNASTWVNDKKNCLILFIKDQDGRIVSLESYK